MKIQIIKKQFKDFCLKGPQYFENPGYGPGPASTEYLWLVMNEEKSHQSLFMANFSLTTNMDIRKPGPKVATLHFLSQPKREFSP